MTLRIYNVKDAWLGGESKYFFPMFFQVCCVQVEATKNSTVVIPSALNVSKS